MSEELYSLESAWGWPRPYQCLCAYPRPLTSFHTKIKINLKKTNFKNVNFPIHTFSIHQPFISVSSAFYQPFIILISFFYQPFISLSSAFYQPFISLSSAFYQPFISLSSAFYQPFISLSSAFHQVLNGKYRFILCQLDKPGPVSLCRASLIILDYLQVLTLKYGHYIQNLHTNLILTSHTIFQ